eukprot:1915029-Amphidinium_carterae.1
MQSSAFSHILPSALPSNRLRVWDPHNQNCTDSSRLCLQGISAWSKDDEAVNTYEGTADIHALVLGRALTGIPAFAAR